jgi:hypothetical protein
MRVAALGGPNSDETLDPLKKVHLVVDELVLTKRGF